ncbi:MAG: hypothetical protein H6650_06425 [Ardenticatenales bacterium]|nr:hypothetical protein [Ardenticatenales bacterium]
MPDDASFSSDAAEGSNTSTSTSEGLSDAGISAMQGPPDAPAEHTPQRAHGDAGDAERAETGAEKTEKKDFYGPANPEGSAPTPPEGWRPGGPER